MSLDLDALGEYEDVRDVHLVRFVCELCNYISHNKLLHLKHMSSCRRKESRRLYTSHPSTNDCNMCNLRFLSPVLLEYHSASVHRCKSCNFEGDRKEVIRHNLIHQKQIGKGVPKYNKKLYNDIRPFKSVRAFNGYVLTYRHTCETNYPSLISYLCAVKPYVQKLLRKAYADLKAVKAQLTIHVTFRRYLCESETGKSIYEYQHKYINSNMLVVLHTSNFQKFYKLCTARIENTTNIFEQYGSGWQVDCVTGCDLRIGIYRPFKGGCWMDIPVILKNKKCIINVKNYDNMCFKWAILAALHKPELPNQKVNQTRSYKHCEDMYDFACIKFPVKINKIPKFEAVNNLSINIFSWEWKDGLVPIQISEFNYTSRKTVDLIILKHPRGDHVHYAAVKDISRLLGKRNCHKKLLCYNCMQLISQCRLSCNQELCERDCTLKDHLFYCNQFKFQKVVCPSIDNLGNTPTIRFTNIKKQLKCPYVIYADFESLLLPYMEPPQKPGTKKPISNTEKRQLHSTSGFAYAVVKQGEVVITHRVYRGPKAVDIFLEDMFRIAELIVKILAVEVKIKMSVEEEEEYQNSSHCHICELEFQEGEIVCRDHCHITGEYRGAAHSSPCNINYKLQDQIPIVTHNFRGYDSHFIVKGFGKCGEYFRVIPTNSEKYLAVTVDTLFFIDSLQFLNSSLANLVENLKVCGEERTNFNILHQIFNEKSVSLLLRKGVYPYDYMDSWKRFDETCLPPIRAFHNTLKKEDISNADYTHAKNIFNHFNMQNLGDYHDLYLLTDTLQLACVFENFRKLSLRIYKLDPVHYMSAPGLAWDAALRMTRVELDMITDITIHEFLEIGIRGGISMITHRRAEAYNKYMPQYKGTEDDENQLYLLYLDMNNLYGIAMQQSLPVNKFRWLEEEEIETLDISSFCDEDEDGYIIQCDLLYPSTLHELHNDYPLAPERMKIPTELFGKYQSQLLEKLGIKYMENQSKLIPHLGSRKNYILHYRNLKYYLEKGMELVKISKVLTFKQRPWLEPYITFNTKQRINCKNAFESSLYKLMNNAVYGKGMENVRNRISVNLVNKVSKAQWLISKPQYITHDILAPNLCAFRMKKNFVTLDKPIYTGFAVLELSKLYMYQFHYEFTKKEFGKRAQLLMTDTDSLAYSIRSKDVYAELKPHLELFDTSGYPPDHQLYSPKNKMVLGKMKDEANSNILYKFIGLGPKSYCFVGSERETASTTFEKKAMKGIPKYIQNRCINYDMLDTILKEQDMLICNMTQLRSYKHEMYTINTSKSALHGFDSKRFISDNGIETLAWGHFAIPL